MKLLIVDDNQKMRKMIRSIVAELDDTVFECEDGDEVVPLYKQTMPDFVLMDINMVRVSGIMATENLRKEFPEARVLIITNFSEKEIHKAAKEAGAEKYFMKDDIMEVKNYLIQQKKKI